MKDFVWFALAGALTLIVYVSCIQKNPRPNYLVCTKSKEVVMEGYDPFLVKQTGPRTWDVNGHEVEADMCVMGTRVVK